MQGDVALRWAHPTSAPKIEMYGAAATSLPLQRHLQDKDQAREPSVAVTTPNEPKRRPWWHVRSCSRC